MLSEQCGGLISHAWAVQDRLQYGTVEPGEKMRAYAGDVRDTWLWTWAASKKFWARVIVFVTYASCYIYTYIMLHYAMFCFIVWYHVVLYNIITYIKLYDIVFQYLILYYRIYYIVSDYIFQVFGPFCRESRKSRATCMKGILPPQFGSCQPVESSVTRGDRQSACLTFRMMSGRPRTWRQDLFKPGES